MDNKPIHLVWWNNGLQYEDKEETLLGAYDNELKAIDVGFNYTLHINSTRPPDVLSHYYIQTIPRNKFLLW